MSKWICAKCKAINPNGAQECHLCGNQTASAGTIIPNTLTDWEVGQILITFSDTLTQCWEFKESHPALFEMIQKQRREIGDAFEKLGSHSFGIYSNKDKDK